MKFLEHEAYMAVMRALAVKPMDWVSAKRERLLKAKRARANKPRVKATRWLTPFDRERMGCDASHWMLQGKEKLLTDLRKELNITNDQHAQFLGTIMEDEIVIHVREKGPSAKVSKDLRKKVEGARPSLAGATTPTAKKSKKEKPKPPPAYGTGAQRKAAPTTKIDEYVGKKVKRWWQDEGAWFDGIVTDYKPDQGHCIVYDFNTENESFEWYDIRRSSTDECVVLDGPPVTNQAGAAGGPFTPNGAGPSPFSTKVTTCTTAEELENLKSEIRAREEQLRRELDAMSDSESDMSDDGAA